ncbi:unnamed protein product, partial [Heterosigma akashiwo]
GGAPALGDPQVRGLRDPAPGHAAHRGGVLPPAVQDLEGAGEPAPGAPELGGHGLPGGVRAGPALGLGRHGLLQPGQRALREDGLRPRRQVLRESGGAVQQAQGLRAGGRAGMSPTFLEDLRFNLDIARTEEAAAAKA